MNHTAMRINDGLLLVLQWASGLLVMVLGLALIASVVIWNLDRRQTRHTIRRNFPLIGRFRYLFETLGAYFRQYFFSLDREEMPFNRAQRGWIYRAAKNIDNTVAFGSTQNLQTPGTILFLNGGFPHLENQDNQQSAITIGDNCPNPYTTSRIFHISGMSYGALSRPAVEALSAGAHAAGCWLNTGEGGLSAPHLSGNADLVFQIGTAKYGVRNNCGELDENKLKTIAENPRVKMFEIKLSQGAKPGKGGILPGAKVTPEIAAVRGIPAGQPSISPNRHPEIDSPTALLDFIEKVRRISGKPVGFKTVVGATDWLETLCKEINHRGSESAPDFITVDGGDGGTGAAPMALMDSVGLPLRESLPWMVDLLMRHDLKQRVRVIASGKLLNPSDAAWALCIGADFVVSARGFLFSLGCIQAMQCNRNTCPTGITTHNAKLQRGLVPADKAPRVAHYQQNLEKELQIIAHACGVDHARLLRRHHARVVLESGSTVTLAQHHPYPS